MNKCLISMSFMTSGRQFNRSLSCWRYVCNNTIFPILFEKENLILKITTLITQIFYELMIDSKVIYKSIINRKESRLKTYPLARRWWLQGAPGIDVLIYCSIKFYKSRTYLQLSQISCEFVFLSCQRQSIWPEPVTMEGQEGYWRPTARAKIRCCFWQIRRIEWLR